MLYSMLEESGGSNGSSSLRYRPELDFLSVLRDSIIKEHLDQSSPTSVLHLFLCRDLSGGLTHNIPWVLIGRFFFGFSFLRRSGLPERY